MDKRKVGSLYEEKALLYLQENGFTILERNFRTKVGEIDIIAIKNNILRFIEVKYRNNDDFGHPLYAVSKSKQSKIYKAAQFYMNIHKDYYDVPCSFDVISIQGNNIEYIFNSFGAM